MKNIKKYIIYLIIVLITLSATACMKNSKTITYTKDKIEIKLKINDNIKYTLSEDIKDFKSSREDAMILTDKYHIGIDISNELSYSKYNGNFENLKNSHKEKAQDFKEVTYHKINGFQEYNINYMRYEVYFPIKNDKENIVICNIYAPETKDNMVKEIFQSKEIQNILNSITIKEKK